MATITKELDAAISAASLIESSPSFSTVFSSFVSQSRDNAQEVLNGFFATPTASSLSYRTRSLISVVCGVAASARVAVAPSPPSTTTEAITLAVQLHSEAKANWNLSSEVASTSVASFHSFCERNQVFFQDVHFAQWLAKYICMFAFSFNCKKLAGVISTCNRKIALLRCIRNVLPDRSCLARDGSAATKAKSSKIHGLSCDPCEGRHLLDVLIDRGNFRVATWLVEEADCNLYGRPCAHGEPMCATASASEEHKMLDPEGFATLESLAQKRQILIPEPSQQAPSLHKRPPTFAQQIAMLKQRNMIQPQEAEEAERARIEQQSRSRLEQQQRDEEVRNKEEGRYRKPASSRVRRSVTPVHRPPQAPSAGPDFSFPCLSETEKTKFAEGRQHLMSGQSFKATEPLKFLSELAKNSSENLESPLVAGYLLVATILSGYGGAIADIDSYLEQLVFIQSPSEFKCFGFFFCGLALALRGPSHSRFSEAMDNLEHFLQLTHHLEMELTWERAVASAELKKLKAAEAARAAGAASSSRASGKPKSSQKFTFPSDLLKKAPVLKQFDDLIGLAEVKKQILREYRGLQINRRLSASADPKSVPSRHYIFTGNPGTGKTTVAQILAKALHQLEIVKSDHYVDTTGAMLMQDGASKFKDLVDKLKEKKGGVLFIDEVYELDPKKRQGDRTAGDIMAQILTLLENMRHELIVIVAGYRDDIDKWLQCNEGLPSRFSTTIDFPDYSVDEFQEIFELLVSKSGSTLESPDLSAVTARRLESRANCKRFGNARDVRKVVSACLMRRTDRITMDDGDKDPDSMSVDELKVLTRQDVLGPKKMPRDTSAAYKELMAMPGLDEVKKSMEDIITFVELNREKEDRGEKADGLILHRLFLGPPGTGKTTVARLYGSILKDLGLLSDGSFVEKKPADFVGGAVGTTEEITKGLLKSSEGKVLFIDEAYCFNDPNGGKGANSYYKIAVDTLVATLQARPGEDICVLMAGYEDQMDEMLRNVNDGLRRRMNADQAFRFKSYDRDALQQILHSMLRKSNKSMELSTVYALLEHLDKQRSRPNFGNAGEISLLLDSAARAQAARIMQSTPQERAKMDQSMLLLSDFSFEDESSETLEELLDSIVGSPEVKSKILEMEGLVRKLSHMSKADLAENFTNFIFQGPPGTGKTTAARVIGKIMKKIGVLPDQKVIETSADQLQTGYAGQVGPQVTKLMESALGGILFVDEAYALVPRLGSYNQEIVDTLVQRITDEKYWGKMYTVLAGYESDVQKLLLANQGLARRFKQVFTFTAWTAEQALPVFLKKVTQKKFEVGADCHPPAANASSSSALIAVNGKSKAESSFLLQCLHSLANLPNWASGGDVTYFVGKCIAKNALRRDAPYILNSEDIKAACDEMLAEKIKELERSRKAAQLTQQEKLVESSISFAPAFQHVQKHACSHDHLVQQAPIVAASSSAVNSEAAQDVDMDAGVAPFQPSESDLKFDADHDPISSSMRAALQAFGQQTGMDNLEVVKELMKPNPAAELIQQVAQQMGVSPEQAKKEIQETQQAIKVRAAMRIPIIRCLVCGMSGCSYMPAIVGYLTTFV